MPACARSSRTAGRQHAQGQHRARHQEGDRQGRRRPKQVTFEGFFHGIAVFVETATDNNNRTVANVRSYFNKCNGNLGTSGSVEFMFTRLPLQDCGRRPGCGRARAGAHRLRGENIGVDEDAIMIYGPFESFGSFRRSWKGTASKSSSLALTGCPRTPRSSTSTPDGGREAHRKAGRGR